MPKFRPKFLMGLLAVTALMFSANVLADMAASVTLVGATNISPSQATSLQITLSNNNTLADITGVAFSNSLPGTLPDGLKIAGAASYSCTDPADPGFAETGSVTANIGSQAITLAGATIPARANNTDGTCVITIPVTAGTSDGSGVTYDYTIANGAVTGNDGGAVANVGAVTQSIIVDQLNKPTIAKSFSNSTLYLGGNASTLTITLNNSNAVDITGVSLTDSFPVLGSAIIKVAATPAAGTTCGGAPVITAVAGAGSVSISGATIPATGSCTLQVDVEGSQTNGSYDTGSRANTIDKATDFSNDIGIEAAANATANVRVISPLGLSKSFSPSTLAEGEVGTVTITLSNSSNSVLALDAGNPFIDSPIDGVGNVDNTRGLLVTSVGNTCGGTTIIEQTNAVDRGVRLTGGSIPAGGSCTVTADFTATTQVANTPVTYTNTIAEGDVTTTTPGIVSRGRTATILVADTLRVTKSNSASDPRPGNPVVFGITIQNWSASAMSNVRVIDALGNGLTFLTGVINGTDFTPAMSGTGCVGLTNADSVGDSNLTFTIGTVPARSNSSTPGACTITFYAMTDTAAANGSSTTNSIAAGGVCTNNGAGICNGGGASSPNRPVNTEVLTVTKDFAPDGPVSEGTVVTMTVTLENYSANALTNASISDTLPVSGSTQMQVATPANAATTCGGTITAVAGTTSVALNNATVPARAGGGTGAAGSCFLQVDVTAAAGNYTNTANVSATETYANGTTHIVSDSDSDSITFTSALSAAKSFNPISVASGGQSIVTVRLDNSSALALNNVSLTDPLPAGMVLAAVPNAYTTCPGSTSITATPGAGSITLSGATIFGGGSCDLLFTVTATGAADWINTIPAGNITADGGIQNTAPVAATLTYNPPTNLTVAKTTNPSTLTFPGQSSLLTVTINNGTLPVTGLELTDYFTQDGTSGGTLNGMIVAGSPTASTTCPGGVVSAAPGGTSVSISGVSLLASSSCTFSVLVTSASVGGVNNIIPPGSIATDQGLTNAAQATTSLTTQSNIGVTKVFDSPVVKPGERSRLTITFYNATNVAIANLALTDTLPAGMTIPSGPNMMTTCAGGTVSSPASNQISLSGGTLAAASAGTSATCYVQTDVSVAVEGEYLNTIAAGDVTGNSGGASVSNVDPASAILRAKSPLVIHEAMTNLTLDAGDPVGFTTGTDNKSPGTAATLTIRIDNPNVTDVTGVILADTLPAGLTLAQVPNAATTCAGGSVSAASSANNLRLTGATIPATGFCTVTVDVLSNTPGIYTDNIAASSIISNEGITNEEPTSAQLIVSEPPTVNKQFAPAVIPPGGTSRLTLVLGNNNASNATLTSAFTDSLPVAPGAILIAGVPNVVSSCTGAVTATAGTASITLANGSTIPAGGCSIAVDVTGSTAGAHTNSISAGSLQTDLGNNQSSANASLSVSTLGYISGRLYNDNNLLPNGSYDSGTDTPLAGETVELRSGASCAGALIGSTTTDALGNYLFADLPAATYSVCQASQPSGTVNGATSAGGIVSSNGSSGTPGTASNPTATTSQIVGIVLNADGGSGEISGSTGNDFAEIIPSVISGRVFLDENNNGVQNGADSALTGADIDLSGYSYGANGVDDGGAGDDVAVITSTTTDSNGDYSFSSLEPGRYTVTQTTQPANTSNGVTTAGAVGNGGAAGTASNVTTLPSTISTIVLPPNTTSSANNFAEIPQGRRISGNVFLDLNNDGVINATDHGINSVTITLTGTDINGNAVGASTTTDADGNFSFTGLPEGTYTLGQLAQPANTTNGTTTAGSTGGVASNPTATTSRIQNLDLTGSNTVSGDNLFAELASGSPDLAISKTHTPASLGAGSTTGFYTISTQNIGPVPTTGAITIVDTLPAGLTATSWPTTGEWVCGVAGQVVTCNSSTAIAAGASATPIIIQVTVGNGLSGQLLTNTVTVSGGGEDPGFNGNNTDTDSTPISSMATVQGSIWKDLDHDRIKDAGEPLVSGWTVEIINSGVVVGSTTTDSNGEYNIPNIAPGSGYSIQFRDPYSGAVWGNPVPNESGVAYAEDVTGGGNPAGATTASGVLDSLTFLAGTTTVEQSLPLDPAGVIYDSITRAPIQNAVVSISGPAGFNPAIHLVGGVGNVNQTTGPDGIYQYLLLPGAPAGTYSLTVTEPSGYLPGGSKIIPPCTNSLTANAAPDPALVQNSNQPPVAGSTVHNVATCPANTGGLAASAASTQYYLSFVLTPGVSGDVVNNHIPLDMVTDSAFSVVKTSSLINVSRGELVPYSIRITNNLAGVIPNIDITDQIPPGFKYKTGTASLDGTLAEPVINGRVLTWANQTFAVGQTRLIKMLLVVGAGVGEGEYNNLAWAMNNLANVNVSNIASATVRVIADPTFDCAGLIGKVFNDENINGYQDENEAGIANIRLATVRGLLVTTDDKGRYHIACADVPDEPRGSNFILKLDERSLPSGFRITTENPRVIRLTRGKIGKLNFGAAIHRVVRLDLASSAFVEGDDQLLPVYLEQIDNLIGVLAEKPSVLRLAFQSENESRQSAENRLQAVRELIEEKWQEKDCCYPLQIEIESMVIQRQVNGE